MPGLPHSMRLAPERSIARTNIPTGRNRELLAQVKAWPGSGIETLPPYAVRESTYRLTQVQGLLLLIGVGSGPHYRRAYGMGDIFVYLENTVDHSEGLKIQTQAV